MVSRGFGTRTWSLISIGVALNVSLGVLAAAFKLPLYLDSTGTVLVAALVGVGPAIVTASLGVFLVALASPTALAFLPVAWIFSLFWGVASRLGAFQRPLAVLVLSLVSGVLTALAAAPIAAVLFGGVTGGGTDLVVALLRANGQSAMEASFQQGLLVDPLDKLVTGLCVLFILRSIPRRALSAFGFVRPDGDQKSVSYYHPRTPNPQSLSEARAASKPVGSAQLFRSGESLWHRSRFTVKMLILPMSLVVLLQLSGARLGIAMAFLIVVNLAAAGKLFIPAWKTSLRYVLAIGLPLLLIQGLLVPGEGQVIRFLTLDWSAGGLMQTLNLLLRLGGVLLLFHLFLMSTPLHRLAEALGRARVPYPLIFVLLEGVTLVPRIRRRVVQVREVQLGRGISQSPTWNPFRAARTLQGLLLPIIGGLFSELPTRAASLQSRGILCSQPRTPVPREWFDEPPQSVLATLVILSQALLLTGVWLWP